MKKFLVLLFLLTSAVAFSAQMKLEPAQKKKMNTFFSNFSEAGVESFKQGAITDDALLNFALRHVYINKFKSLKKSKDGYSVIASTDQIDAATTKYFGINVRKHKEKSYSIPCADGEPVTFSQIDTLEEAGTKTLKATGTIYTCGSPETPDVHATPAAWKKAGVEVNVTGAFSALIEFEGERFNLLEYSVSDSRP